MLPPRFGERSMANLSRTIAVHTLLDLTLPMVRQIFDPERRVETFEFLILKWNPQ